VNEIYAEKITRSQRIADFVTKSVGSWPFIIWQSVIIALWIGINIFLTYQAASNSDYFKSWDPYPFILLNLVLSFQAAYTGPVVMMSQNRQAQKDRLLAENDYHVNIKAEQEVEEIISHLHYQDELLRQIWERLNHIETKTNKQP
jgi:uncharacterized membrane protein